MTRRRSASLQTDAGASAPASDARPPVRRGASEAAIHHRLSGARTREEAEARYVAARDAWSAAMRAANSGRPADLASLAIAQETYEAAVEERELWLSGARVAIPIETDHGHDHRELEAAITNELAWRVVLDPPKRDGFFSRFRRRRDQDE